MFEDLLHSRDTKEDEWQVLFTKNPFILMDSLPVRLSSIYPHLDLDSGEPDFAFFEHSGPCSVGYYGVVELKRPTDKILRVYSTKHILPSAKLAQARSQVEHYLDDISRSPVLWNQFALTLAHAKYAFIIIGRTDDIVSKCLTETYQLQYRNLLPPGIEIVPYDSLFERFRRTVPKVVVVDLLAPDANSIGGIREPGRFQGLFDEYDISDNAIFKIITTSGWIRMLSGRYRQVFGIPRKLWPIGGNRLGDYYHRELRERVGEANFPKVIETMRAASWPWFAYDIEGEFDTENARWTAGVKMNLKTGKDEITPVEFDGWDFSLYEGDRIYLDGGRPFMYTVFPGDTSSVAQSG